MIRPRTALAAVGLAVLAAALWWRKNPSACPYGQRFWVEAPHPFITRDRLADVLEPATGERILEIGSGTGYYTLHLADAVGREGALEIFDIQQQMLDHTMRRVGEHGLSNVTPTRGDATSLPHPDDSFDAVVLVTVLGEIPEREAALAEIKRVLRPGGRLVVGELFGDPHFQAFGSLQRRCAAAGLSFESRSGPRLGFFARFRA